MTSLDQAEDEPLDPAAERLRRKLVRLLFISGGIMMLGLVAVFAGIIYKLNVPRAGPALASAGQPLDAVVPLPQGARIIATTLDGDRALLTISQADGGTSLMLIDLRSGAVLGRYAFTAPR